MKLVLGARKQSFGTLYGRVIRPGTRVTQKRYLPGPPRAGPRHTFLTPALLRVSRDYGHELLKTPDKRETSERMSERQPAELWNHILPDTRPRHHEEKSAPALDRTRYSEDPPRVRRRRIASRRHTRVHSALP